MSRARSVGLVWRPEEVLGFVAPEACSDQRQSTHEGQHLQAKASKRRDTFSVIVSSGNCQFG